MRYKCIENFRKIMDCLWKWFLWIVIGMSSMYRQVSNIRRAVVGNTIVDHSDVVGASPVGAASISSSFST